MFHVTFTSIELSETPNRFLKMRLVLRIKNAASFIKTCFYQIRRGIKMRKRAETLHVNRGYKLAIVAFIFFLLFTKKKFVVY